MLMQSVHTVTTCHEGKGMSETPLEFHFDVYFIIIQFAIHDQLYPLKRNSVALVRRRTMPTERPPLVGKLVSTFFAE
jgi:hypothetical protein